MRIIYFAGVRATADEGREDFAAGMSIGVDGRRGDEGSSTAFMRSSVFCRTRRIDCSSGDSDGFGDEGSSNAFLKSSDD